MRNHKREIALFNDADFRAVADHLFTFSVFRAGEIIAFPSPEVNTRPLKEGGGGGTYDGMDGWQTSVEARLGELKTEVRGLRDEARVDFRLLFAALIAVALGLAGLMAKGFHWI